MRTLQAALVCLSLVSVPVLADQPDDLPAHILRSIRISVQGVDAVVMATVQGEPKSGKVELRVDRTLQGEMDGAITLSIAPFYEPELVEGAQFLIPLKRVGKARWSGTGHYERVAEGRIRDYSVEAYLAVVSDALEHPVKESRVKPAAESKPLAEGRLVSPEVIRAANAQASAPTEGQVCRAGM